MCSDSVESARLGSSTMGRSGEARKAVQFRRGVHHRVQGIEVAQHHRQRLGRARLAGAQGGNRCVVGGVAQQVIAADAFHRDDFSCAQCGDGSRQRGFIAVELFISRNELQMRPAHRAGDRLGVKAAVERIFVFASAVRAQRKVAHRRIGRS